MKSHMSYGSIQTNENITLDDLDTRKSPEQSSYQNDSFKDSPLHDQSRQTHRTVIRVLYLTVFISSTITSITYASEWPYLTTVDPSASTTFLSWIVAGQNMAQIIASPLFGAWLIWSGRIQKVLIAIILFSIVGMLLYGYCWSVPHDKSHFMFVSRVLTGMGSATIPLVWTYTSCCTTYSEMTSVIARVGAWQSAGLVCGPVFQIIFMLLEHPGIVQKNWLHLDQFTAPAFFSIFLSILNAVIVVVYVKDNVSSTKTKKTLDDRPVDYLQDTVIQGYDWVAMVATVFLFFSATFVYSIFGETIRTPLTMALYDWTPTKATFYNGIIYALQGAICSLVYLLTIYLINKTNEKMVMMTGLVLMLIGVAVMFPWKHTDPVIQASSVKGIPGNSYQTNAVIHIKGRESLGCSEYNWCQKKPRIYIVQYLTASFTVAVGLSLTKVVAYTVYSKLMGTRKQAVLLVLLTSMGGLARSLGPIYVSLIFMRFGPAQAFLTLCVLLVATIACNLWMRDRLSCQNKHPLLDMKE